LTTRFREHIDFEPAEYGPSKFRVLSMSIIYLLIVYVSGKSMFAHVWNAVM